MHYGSDSMHRDKYFPILCALIVSTGHCRAQTLDLIAISSSLYSDNLSRPSQVRTQRIPIRMVLGIIPQAIRTISQRNDRNMWKSLDDVKSLENTLHSMPWRVSAHCDVSRHWQAVACVLWCSVSVGPSPACLS